MERGAVTAATLTNQQLERRWYLTGRQHVEERNLIKIEAQAHERGQLGHFREVESGRTLRRTRVAVAQAKESLLGSISQQRGLEGRLELELLDARVGPASSSKVLLDGSGESLPVEGVDSRGGGSKQREGGEHEGGEELHVCPDEWAGADGERRRRGRGWERTMKFACQEKDDGAEKSTAATAGGGACERREKVEGRADADDVVNGWPQARARARALRIKQGMRGQLVLSVRIKIKRYSFGERNRSLG